MALERSKEEDKCNILQKELDHLKEKLKEESDIKSKESLGWLGWIGILSDFCKFEKWSGTLK